MKRKYERRKKFVTTKYQYLFSAIIKNIEIVALTIFGATTANIVMNSGDDFSLTGTIISALVMGLVLLVFSYLYINIRVNYFKSELPSLVINDSGVYLTEFGRKEKFDWNEITNVQINGRFRKLIKLNDDKGSVFNQIEYYLFPPEQRRAFIPLLASRTKNLTY